VLVASVGVEVADYEHLSGNAMFEQQVDRGSYAFQRADRVGLIQRHVEVRSRANSSCSVDALAGRDAMSFANPAQSFGGSRRTTRSAPVWRQVSQVLPGRPKAQTRLWSSTLNATHCSPDNPGGVRRQNFKSVAGLQRQLIIIRENHQPVALASIQRLDRGRDERTIDLRNGIENVHVGWIAA